MAAHIYEKSPRQSVWFSPYLLAIGLSFALFQTSTPLSCKSGDTTLSEFEMFVQGENRIVGFAPNQRSYNVSLPLGTDEARVRVVTTDPVAQVWVDVLIGTERFRYLSGGLGGADLVVPLPPGPSVLQVWVRAPKGASDHYDVGIETGGVSDFCIDQPADCSASNDCLTDGVCDPTCDPIDAGNGLCDRCPGKDDLAPDGTTCTQGICFDGICQELTPPKVRSVSPADGSVDVPFNTRSISVFFDEDMDRPSMLSATYFTDSAGVSQGAGKAYYDDGVLLNVLYTLKPNETYYVHVTTDAMDLVGNHLEEEFVSSFTTGDPPVDSTPPKVRSVSPADGSVDVPFNTRSISVFFDEDMDRPSMLSATYFTDSAGVSQGAGKAYYDDGVLLNVLYTLKPNETYYVHVTTGAMDLAGNHLEEEFVSSFTTQGSSGVAPANRTPNFTPQGRGETPWVTAS